MRKLYLVACSKQKQPSGTHKAKDLYTSPWFTLARAYVEKQLAHDEDIQDYWAILSAKHGFLFPWQRIEPYELSLLQISEGQRLEWLFDVVQALRQNFGGELNKLTVVFLAGGEYRTVLADWLLYRGATIEVPMKGLGIGRQLAWLKAQTEGANARTL